MTEEEKYIVRTVNMNPEELMVKFPGASVVRCVFEVSEMVFESGCSPKKDILGGMDDDFTVTDIISRRKVLVNPKHWGAGFGLLSECVCSLEYDSFKGAGYIEYYARDIDECDGFCSPDCHLSLVSWKLLDVAGRLLFDSQQGFPSDAVKRSRSVFCER